MKIVKEKTSTKKSANTSQDKKSAPFNISNDPDKVNLFTSLFSTQWNTFFDTLSSYSKIDMNDYIGQWQNYLALQKKITEELPPFATETNPAFETVKQYYQTMSEQTQTWIDKIIENTENPKTKRKIKFLAKQLIEALHPNNFVHTNPEILKALFESKGDNFLQGFKQFLQDAEVSNALFNIQSADPEKYVVGENIAVTAGKVIYQNDLIQLIQYEPRTPTVHQVPLLIIPPWINKYYILDLQAENSYVKWILDQGYSVFLISWVNPTKAQASLTFADYMDLGPLTAMNIVKEIAGVEKINILGYCIGGTLLACTLAYLSAKGKSLLNSATFLTTLLDFSDPGELGAFIDEQQLAYIESYMQKNGYLNGEFMAAVFNMLRPQELLWSNYVNRYLKGEKPLALDFLNWNADPTNVAAQVHQFYLREMYLNNSLTKPGGIRLDDTPIDLAKIKLPCYFLAAKKDHITPWSACYKSMLLLKGEKRFVLANSGHVAGVVNPPHKNKYGYLVNENLPLNPDEWLTDATLHPGSWWTDWAAWLENYSGEKISAKKEVNHKYKPLEDAPGSYVKTKL